MSKISAGSNSHRYLFDLNRYTEEDEEGLREFASKFTHYLVYCRQSDNRGRTSLRGFFITRKRHSISFIKKTSCFARAHFDVTREKSHEVAESYKESGNFEEFGVLPADSVEETTNIVRNAVCFVSNSTEDDDYQEGSQEQEEDHESCPSLQLPASSAVEDSAQDEMELSQATDDDEVANYYMDRQAQDESMLQVERNGQFIEEAKANKPKSWVRLSTMKKPMSDAIIDQETNSFAQLSDYEKVRAMNIERNNQRLRSLGLLKECNISSLKDNVKTHLKRKTSTIDMIPKNMYGTRSSTRTHHRNSDEQENYADEIWV